MRPLPQPGTKEREQQRKSHEQSPGLDAHGLAIVAALNSSLGGKIDNVDAKVEAIGSKVVVLDERLNKHDECLTKQSELINSMSNQMQKAVQQEVAKAWAAMPKSVIKKDDEQQRQVIATGFDTDTPASTVIAKVDAFLEVGSRRYKVEAVDTFTDPAPVGVITFETEQAKKGFYRKVKGHEVLLENWRKLIFRDNDPWPVRMRNKAMGQAKYQINKQLGTALKDIKIDRAVCEVRIKDKKVARFASEDALRLQYDETVKAIAEEVGKAMESKTESKQE